MNQSEDVMRRFEFVEGKSSKFWQIEQIAADLHIQWGRIGTAGQSQVKTFVDESKAQAAQLKLIAEKTAKGYLEVDTAPAAAPAPATPPPPESQAAPTSAVAATQSTAENEAVAPWLANGDPVQIPADLMELVLPSRDAPLPVVAVDAAAAWQEMREHLATFARFDLDRCAPSLREHVETALRRLQQDAIGEACVNSDAVLLRLLMDGANHLKVRDRMLDSRFVEYLIARHGLPGALEVLLASQPWLLCQEFRADAKPGQRYIPFLQEGNRQLEPIGATERVLRRHLAVAPEREWAVCAARIREILPTRPPTSQVALALLLPEAPELAADVAARLLKQDNAEAASYLLANLRDPALIADIVKACQRGHYFSPMSFWGDQALLLSAVHTLGSGAEQLLIPAAAEQIVYQALSCIGTPRSIATLALQLTHDDRAKTLAAHFRDALRHWPLAAITALAGLLTGERSALHLHPYFAALVREQIGQVPRLLPWLAPQAREVLRREAAKFDDTRPIATQDELPAVLASPPWLRPRTKKAVRAMLAEDPLDLFPARRSPLPSFWQPHCWTRPLLRDSGKALPPPALDALGQMMTFPVVDGLYAGLVQVREACTPHSLAEFAWDCFVAWFNHDTPVRGNWPFTMLGHLGNDDTARRLTVLIRIWPSEGRFGRSLAGLDVLATIGSDVSLMLLNGIAQKVKSKSLQDRAREKIQAIAQTRGLSREELEDRLVPIFGLDAKGTLELDFGPRRFTVGFDEMLRPYVRDESGARLANLPKPRQSDDAEKSQTATNLFKQLKKDVRTVASEQVRRLEAAMCSRRRWLPEAFRQCLVEHPLLRHLVQRLVWGVYAVEGLEDGESGRGGSLLQCFRIAEDGSATSPADDPLTLPEGGAIRYGLPHALELQAEDAAVLARLFADYQLLQPFAQLDRSTYTLSDSELAGGQLERWRGLEIDTRRLLGLAQRGWHRGTPQDAACYHDYGKPLDERRVMLLSFAPGIPVDMPEEEPTQILGTVSFGEPWGFAGVREEPFATLDPIAASELIRDLEYLCA